jgi:enoyl-[acyl-carrier-protein] reductase (NADH)
MHNRSGAARKRFVTRERSSCSPAARNQCRFVESVAKAIEPRLLLALDVETDGSLEKVFEQIRTTFGRLDFVLHLIASCPKQDLRGRVTDCSRDAVLNRGEGRGLRALT